MTRKKLHRDRDGHLESTDPQGQPLYYKDSFGTAYCCYCAQGLKRKAKVTSHVNEEIYIECQGCFEFLYGTRAV